MSAKSTYLARSGMSFTVAADGALVPAERGPDIYAHVQRRGFMHVEWEITAGLSGEPLAWGTTWTRGGANAEAIAAAHRPGITRAVTR